jgi:hypothetical protein
MSAMGRASQAMGDTHERGIDDRPAYRSDRERGGAMRADRPGADRCSAVTMQPGLGTHVRLVADRPGKGSRFSAAKNPSSNASADSHARIFGLSLAALWAACLVLNVASPSTRICQQFDRDFGTNGTDSVSASTRVAPALGDGSHVEPSVTIRSKECPTNRGGEEPGYFGDEKIEARAPP